MNIIIEVSNGNIKVHEGKSISKTLTSLLDGIYDISITKHKNKRSLQQNRYYWGVVVPFVKDFFNARDRIAPMTDKQAHAQIKDMCGIFEEMQIYDKNKNAFIIKRIYGSFSNAGDLSTVDFMNICDILREAISVMSDGEFILPEPKTPL